MTQFQVIQVVDGPKSHGKTKQHLKDVEASKPKKAVQVAWEIENPSKSFDADLEKQDSLPYQSNRFNVYWEIRDMDQEKRGTAMRTIVAPMEEDQ